MAYWHQNSADEVVDPAQTARNARIGLTLFAVYSALYVTFMLLNAFLPQSMEQIVIAGLNLAIVYGLGLIIAAFLLAVLYAWLCRQRARPEPKS